MVASRIIITAINSKWAYHAARAMTGFASSVIACGCEAAIEKPLKPIETPDGRPGVAILFFAMSAKALARHLPTRVGQSVMTTATSACYSGIENQDNKETIPMGKHLRYFGDGYQISKVINDKRYWRIPVMHGEFICEEHTPYVKGIGGGNFLILSETIEQGLNACEKAVAEIQKISGVITAFPGGIVGSGSKVGSKYKALNASTNEAFCPSLKHQVQSELEKKTGSVLEIVINGLTEKHISNAMKVGIETVCAFGIQKGIQRIGAGNYGGKLGPHLFHLRKIMS